jgi:hypothetical protein
VQINVIITGSTGMVGKGALLECIESPDVSSVLLINRSRLGIVHPKVKEIIHKDFFDWAPICEDLKGYNACFFCMGVSSAGMKEEDYHRMTYDITLGFAKELLPLNPDMTFCYVSGTGTSTAMDSRMMWANVKGKTENDLLSLGFKSAYMFRPGYIQPFKGTKSKVKVFNVIYAMLSPFYSLLKRMPKYVTDTITIGKAMIGVSLRGYSKNVLESWDINTFKS